MLFLHVSSYSFSFGCSPLGVSTANHQIWTIYLALVSLLLMHFYLGLGPELMVPKTQTGSLLMSHPAKLCVLYSKGTVYPTHTVEGEYFEKRFQCTNSTDTVLTGSSFEFQISADKVFWTKGPCCLC